MSVGRMSMITSSSIITDVFSSTVRGSGAIGRTHPPSMIVDTWRMPPLACGAGAGGAVDIIEEEEEGIGVKSDGGDVAAAMKDVVETTAV